MGANSLFDTTINLAERALDLRAQRHETLLSNVANADTPGYKAFDLLVDEALARQVAGQGGMPVARTDPHHLTAGAATSGSGQPQKVQLPAEISLRGDGNTVDMDREMSALAANQLQYKLSTQLLAKKFQSLRNIIKGGRQ